MKVRGGGKVCFGEDRRLIRWIHERGLKTLEKRTVIIITKVFVVTLTLYMAYYSTHNQLWMGLYYN